MTNTSSDQPSPSSVPPETDTTATKNQAPPKKKETIFDWLDQETRKIGKSVNESKFHLGMYGGYDGCSTAYSIEKLMFDFFFNAGPRPSADIMHDWMLTPEGIAATASWSVFVIGFSVLGNVFKKKDEGIQGAIARLQPYFRVVMKGLKNSYKGIRSTLQAASLLSGEDLRHLMLPLGLALGIISVANRLWYQQMVDKRKAAQDNNDSIYNKIQAFKLNPYVYLEDKERIDSIINGNFSEDYKPEGETSNLAFLSALQSGLTEGLYLFMGCLTVTSFSTVLLIPVLVLTAIFSLLLMINRVYEEKMFQDKLVVSQEKINLALSGMMLKAILLKLQDISEQLAFGDDPDANELTTYTMLVTEQKGLLTKLEEEKCKFEATHQKLKKLQISTYKTAVLTGIRHGLYAYSMITSVLFGVSTISAILAAPVSPLLVLGFAIAGVASLIGFIAHALWNHSQHQSQLDKPANPIVMANEKLIELLKRIKSDKNAGVLTQYKSDYIKEVVDHGMLVDPSPQYAIQEAFEIARSFASGFTKGQKSVDFILNPLLDIDDKGHPHDTPLLLGVIGVYSVGCGIGLGLKACEKGFGKDQQVNDALIKSPSSANDLNKVSENRSAMFSNKKNSTTSSDNLIGQAHQPAPSAPEYN